MTRGIISRRRDSAIAIRLYSGGARVTLGKNIGRPMNIIHKLRYKLRLVSVICCMRRNGLECHAREELVKKKPLPINSINLFVD